MAVVDKETFSYWVTHPEALTPDDQQQVEESRAAWPYCQMLHTLAAKAAALHDRPATVPHLRRAAVHALSRNALRKLIDNEFRWSDNLLTKLNELAQRNVAIPEDYQRESYAIFKSKPSAGLASLPILKLPTLHFAREPFDDLPPADDATLVEQQLQDTLPQPPATAPPDPLRQQQQEIIDAFIKKAPSIARPVPNAPLPVVEPVDLAKPSTQPAGGLVTEAFAKILLKQGKTDKALDVYKQLALKNPEKTAYFAGKIAEILATQAP